MADGTTGVLRRMAKGAARPPAATPSRALRLALTRAAERSVGLPLAVLDLLEDEGPLDDLLARLEPGLMLLALRRDGDPVGLVALDGEARAATTEVQALGAVSPAPAPPREATAADAALARPLLDAFLGEAGTAVAGTPLAPWLAGATTGARLAAPREAPLLLPDGRYRAVRLALDLGAGGRRGLLALLLRLPDPPGARDLPTPAATLAAGVLDAEAPVEAVLARLSLTVAEAGTLAPGLVLPLPGVTVASVRLEAGGALVAAARLGQVAGRRAVRLETAPPAGLSPLTPSTDASWPAPPPPTWGDASDDDWLPPGDGPSDPAPPNESLAADGGDWPSLPVPG